VLGADEFDRLRRRGAELLIDDVLNDALMASDEPAR
jgi:hypothetical protein